MSTRSRYNNNMAGDGLMNNERNYVITLDVGSTTIRSHVYDDKGVVQGSCSRKVVSISTTPMSHEVEPEPFFDSILTCINGAIKDSDVSPDRLSCLGITTQRNTFITWDRVSGKTYHNFISWLDLRSRDIVTKWNNSYTLKFLHGGAKFIHLLTKRDKFKGLGTFSFETTHVSMRLLWALENIPVLRHNMMMGDVMFGCMETWIVWKLTKGQVFATDYSCASSSGLYDTFDLKWSTDLQKMLNIPSKLQMPEVRDTSGDFGICDDVLFGAPIPITCVLSRQQDQQLLLAFYSVLAKLAGSRPSKEIGDQQSAMFGQCCFEPGDIKCTLGTGSFIHVNTGDKLHVSHQGLSPVIGWKIGDDIVYMTEGGISDTGNTVEWAHSIGLIDDVSKSSEVAQSVPDSGGVSFVSSFGGLEVILPTASFTDNSATSSIIGATPNTCKAHILRAILESCAFRFKLLFDVLCSEIKVPLVNLRFDGGVSQNDFLMQLITDLSGKSLERSQNHDMTAIGAAFLAGLSTGVWRDMKELKSLRRTTQSFTPNESRWQDYKDCYLRWQKAVRRTQHCHIEKRHGRGKGCFRRRRISPR